MFNYDLYENDMNEIIDCTFYQSVDSCHTIPSIYQSNCMIEKYLNQSILTSETNFRPMRNYLNDIRCRMLTKLVQRNITGLEFIQAFEQAPNMIENMYMSNSNIHNDKFIDQLADITHDVIIKSPYKCMPTSHISSTTKIDHKFQPSLLSSSSSQSIASPPKIKSNSPSFTTIKPKTNSNSKEFSPLEQTNLSSSSSPPFTISKSLPSRAVTPPKSPSPILSSRSSEDQSYSMGYQWKGEDN
ncbi:unnamed protein product [Adineta steineri]|uniref:Uncharacterized protein n=1 Tax=Adineta steineri TaxID=433720 RepID=A0A818Q787_9BILA|nr:unnamed protein product [Adineta steineri]CAF4111739.1 unnamed protein product [Adineta steineri]